MFLFYNPIIEKFINITLERLSAQLKKKSKKKKQNEDEEKDEFRLCFFFYL